MYNYKANSISSVIPNHILDNYPKFEEFIKIYYIWQQKTTLEFLNPVGNVSIGSHIYGVITQYSTPVEVNVEMNKSIITEFDADSQKSFLEGENVFSYTDHSEPIEITLSEQNEFLFNGLKLSKITLFNGIKYRFYNNTEYEFYVKTNRTYGSSFLFGLVQNNGTIGSIIEMTITDTYPDFLYFTSNGANNIGIFNIYDMSTEFYTDIVNSGLSEISVWGFGKLNGVLFHPEYLFNNFSDLSKIHAPNTFFYRYLQEYGLENFFQNNFKNRKAIQDFVRFFRQRGTEDSIKFFFQNFFSKSANLSYPSEEVLKTSDANYFTRRRMYVTPTENGVEMTRNRLVYGQESQAIGIIETVLHNRLRDFYELYFIKSKMVGNFIPNEELYVVDDEDGDVIYHVGQVNRTVDWLRINQPGEEYQLGEVISNTYELFTEDLTITVNVLVEDIDYTSIDYVNIDVPGSGYSEGEEVLFPAPSKRTEFHGYSLETSTSPTNYTIGAVFYDVENYTLDYSGAVVQIGGIIYNITSYNESTQELQFDTSGQAPRVSINQLIVLRFDESRVTDPYYNVDYFHPDTSVIKNQAKGIIQSVDVNGGIHAITLRENGNGYIKKPTTVDDSIFIATTSGAGAEVTVSGQGFGGITKTRLENDIVNISHDMSVTLHREGIPDEKNAIVRLFSGPTTQYGRFFKDNKGFISDKIFIQDSYYYQDYSYVIKSDLNYSEFAGFYRQLVHPVGMIFFNEYLLSNELGQGEEGLQQQRINDGLDRISTLKKITIEKDYMIEYEYDLSIILRTFISRYYMYDKLLRDFHWASESLLTLTDDYGFETYSGVVISDYENQTLDESTLISRTFEENPIEWIREVRLETTVSGTGTLSFEDVTTSGDYSGLLTISGSNTTFYQEVSPMDILYSAGEEFFIVTIMSDTELIAQRINITNTISGVLENFEIYRKRKTELLNASFLDIIDLNDINTLGDNDIYDTKVKDIDEVFINY